MELFLGFLLQKPSWLIQKEALERNNIHALSTIREPGPGSKNKARQCDKLSPLRKSEHCPARRFIDGLNKQL